MGEIKNAKIMSTYLGYEDHGVLTCSLTLTFEDGNQTFGNYRLDNNQGEATVYTGIWVQSILKAVGVRHWEELQGKYCRICREDGMIVSIGNLMEPIWFEPRKVR